MESAPVLCNAKDRIYLDTTYCAPEYDRIIKWNGDIYCIIKWIGDIHCIIKWNGDTTYCAPEYDLLSQRDVIAMAVDLVTWWREHATEFPLLARYYRAHCAFQATSTASERVYNVEGLVFTKFRSKFINKYCKSSMYVNIWLFFINAVIVI